MSRIHVLDAATANAIAAGEVIERPMSIVKELMENSIDAGATQITVEIKDGGITFIRVRDNGCGMDEEDAMNAFICHATSKITSLDELFSLHSMGFRGEALASISAAAKVTLTTKEPLAERGTCIRYEGGQFISCTPVGASSGTTVEVSDLFYNLPARFKFLKKDQTEANYIQVLVERFILCHTDISFKFIKNGKTILNSPGNCDPASALYTVYGKEIVNNCRPIDCTIDGITVKGFAGLPHISRASRSEQIIFVNQRLIRSKTISAAIDAAYTNMLMKGKYAFVILDILMPSSDLDVNVHPQKAEVRFSNESVIYRAVYHAIMNTLAQESMSVDYSFSKEDKAEKNQVEEKKEAVHEAIKPEPVRDPGFVAPLPQTPPKAVSSSASSYPPKDFTSSIGYKNAYFTESTLQETPSSYSVSSTDIPNLVSPVENDKQEPSLSEPEKEFTQPELPASAFTSKEESLSELLSSRVIGTLFDTYILMESPDKQLLMIDQHAAHEKILYEKLVDKEQKKEVVSQPLLAPVIISMSRSDISFIEENMEQLTGIGFEISSLGDNDLAIRSIPAQIEPESVRESFIAMVDEWMHASKTQKDALILSLATSACKAAVKGHDKLHDIEIQGLIEQLSKLRDPYHCPHGRPILIRLSQNEIEKEFKRIV